MKIPHSRYTHHIVAGILLKCFKQMHMSGRILCLTHSIVEKIFVPWSMQVWIVVQKDSISKPVWLDK